MVSVDDDLYEVLKDVCLGKNECIERIKSFEPTFHLSDDKQKALDDIYARAEKELGVSQ